MNKLNEMSAPTRNAQVLQKQQYYIYLLHTLKVCKDSAETSVWICCIFR